MAQRQNWLDPGRMDQTITIQSAAIGGSWGGSDPDWDNPVTVQTCRANVLFIPGRSREGFDGKAVDSMVQWHVRMGYMTGITTKMRISWNSTVFQITVVDPSQQAEGYLDLYCTEFKA